MVVSGYKGKRLSDEFEQLVQQLARVTGLDKQELVGAIRDLGSLNDERAIPHLIRVMGYHRSPKPNNAASQEVAKFGAKAVEPLIAALPPNPLHPNDVWRRYWVIRTLGDLRDMRAFEPLIETLNTTSELTVAGAVAEAMEKFEDKRAIEPLQRALARFDTPGKLRPYSVTQIFWAINYVTRRGK
jgi:HEAT repeat protein